MPSYAESCWWRLSESERAAYEQAVDHIVYRLYRGNRASVLSLIASARARGLDALSDAAAAILWLLAEKVDQDE